MTIKLKGRILQRSKFAYPFRIILSGSSQSGKTSFAAQLLKNDLFDKKPSCVRYFYPSYLDEPPVSWHNLLPIPVSYQVGLPSKDDLLSMDADTVVVLDDLYDLIVKSEVCDHLFRVFSGKRSISVIVMNQNYYTQGKYGRDIRNSANFTVLFRNCCDTSINKRVSKTCGLLKAYESAFNSTQK